MEIQTATRFFLWCTIIDGGLLLFWTGACLLAPDRVYRIQNRFFPMPRATYNTVMYVFIGAFKLLVIVFNVTPLLALLIVG